MGTDLKKATTERVYGFELLRRRRVPSAIGLMLQHHGAPLSKEER